MIRVTVELVKPNGKISTIGRARIANDLSSNDLEIGNYEYDIDGYGMNDGAWSGRVEGFARTKYDVWTLISEMLNDREEFEV